MDTEKIYFDLSTDTAYRSDNSEIANDNIPEFRYKGERKIQWQFLNTATLTNNVFTDVYTGLAALTISATSSIDNDAKHYDDGNPNATITGGVAITTLPIKNLTETPRICGRLKLTNDAGETETINYNEWSLANAVYTFTLANASYVAGAQTPTYTYLATDDCRVLQIPIVKDSAVDVTSKATGLLETTLDCFKLVYQDMIEGETEITGCKHEIIVLDASLKQILVKQIPVKLLYIQDDDGAVGPAPDKDYLTDVENMLKYIQILSGTQAPLTDDAATNIIIFDKTLAGSAVIALDIIGSAGKWSYPAISLNFFGATASIMPGACHKNGTIAGTIAIGADISSNNVRMIITLAGVGANLKAVYKVSQNIIEV